MCVCVCCTRVIITEVLFIEMNAAKLCCKFFLMNVVMRDSAV